MQACGRRLCHEYVTLILVREVRGPLTSFTVEQVNAPMPAPEATTRGVQAVVDGASHKFTDSKVLEAITRLAETAGGGKQAYKHLLDSPSTYWSLIDSRRQGSRRTTPIGGRNVTTRHTLRMHSSKSTTYCFSPFSHPDGRRSPMTARIRAMLGT